MKKSIFLLAVIGVVISFSWNRQAADKNQTINPIIGDISFVQKFGHQPDATTDENLRIQTHFEFVENLLRQKEVSHLTPVLQQKRLQLIQLLHRF